MDDRIRAAYDDETLRMINKAKELDPTTKEHQMVMEQVNSAIKLQTDDDKLHTEVNNEAYRRGSDDMKFETEMKERSERERKERIKDGCKLGIELLSGFVVPILWMTFNTYWNHEAWAEEAGGHESTSRYKQHQMLKTPK